MLHHFRCNGDIVAYDTETQALMLLDGRAGLLLDALAESTDSDGFRLSSQELDRLQLMTGATAPELEEILAEFAHLEAAGEINQPAPVVTLEQMYPEPPRVKSMCLHLCHDCNLRCRYCFAGQGDYGTGTRDMLSAEVGKRAIDWLIESSGRRHNLDIDFFGGEPLMNWAVVKELVAYCEEQGPLHNKAIRLTMTTNALLLDQEKRTYVNEHFKNVVLSIDGRPETNDYMRPAVNGRSATDVILKNIKSFAELRGDREYYVRGTYTHFNTDFSEDVLYLADEGLEQLSVEPVVADPAEPYAFTDEDLPVLLEQYESLAQAYLDRRGTEDAFNFFHFNIDLEEGPCLYKRMKGCGVGTEYCSVSPNGDIYPCHQFVGDERWKMGNVMEDDGVLDPAVQEQFRHLMVPDKPECLDCWARYFCAGGCAANNVQSTGSLDGLYAKGCAIQRKRLECALWIKARELEAAGS